MDGIEQVIVKASRPDDRQSVSLHPVYYDFRIGPFRLKGNGKAWRKLEEEAGTSDISFKRFRPFLSRPRRDLLEKLQAYAETDPQWFTVEVHRAACAAVALCRTRPRGGSPYPYSPTEMDEIRALSKHLYIFIQYWIRRPRSEWSKALQTAVRGTEVLRGAKYLVPRIMKTHYPRLPEAVGVSNDWYRRFVIADGDLRSLKKFHNAMGYKTSTIIYQRLDGSTVKLSDLL
jgi:hypothetical protein